MALKKIEKKPMTNNSNKFSSEEVYDRILKIIADLSEKQQRNLLDRLEKWRRSKFKEKRKYPRKQTFIWAECSANRRALNDFIQNLSVGGLFIETQIPFFVGEGLSMTFSLSGADDPIKITGKIVRVNTRGIAVQFDEVLTDI